MNVGAERTTPDKSASQGMLVQKAAGEKDWTGIGMTVFQEEVVQMTVIETIPTTIGGIILVIEEAKTPIGGTNAIPTMRTAMGEGQKTITTGHHMKGIITIERESAFIRRAGVQEGPLKGMNQALAQNPGISMREIGETALTEREENFMIETEGIHIFEEIEMTLEEILETGVRRL